MKRTLPHACVLRIAPLLVALAGIFVCIHAATACPTCSEAAAANDPEHEHMVKGYFYSILFMMGVPYTVFMCFVGYMYWEVKKARARSAAQAPGATSNSKPPLVPVAAAAEPSPPQPSPPPEHSPPEPAVSRELVEA